MNEKRLRELLEEIKAGGRGIDETVEILRNLPFEDLGFARLDTHRELRTGAPEVIFAPGKTVEQLTGLIERSLSHSGSVMVSRIEAETACALGRKFPDLVHAADARTLSYREKKPDPKPGFVALVSAGTADLPVAQEAAVTLEFLGSRVERIWDVGVAGLHRLAPCLERLQQSRSVIVVAGMEGALASVVGGLIGRPVIAVPTSVGYGANFHGLSALLGMLNSCSPGVAVVNIDNGFGAACFAHLI
jgi:NCAIR mutase (PurE)-related protein